MFETVANKRVLVTGASSGIGASIARLFAEYGACVGIHYAHSESPAQAVLTQIEKTSGRGQLFRADLLDPAASRGLIANFVRVFGGIDVLVNNAGGVTDYEHFSTLDESAWDKAFVLQVKAPFLLSREAFGFMKTQCWGRIINISTAAIKYAGPTSLHYTASKAALEVIAKGLAREGAKYNILVNVIRSGLIDTPMRTKLANYDEQAFQRRIGLVPLGRPGKPLDISRMTLFLASECGDFITGERFTVAGGD